jgi:hypothetical protein
LALAIVLLLADPCCLIEYNTRYFKQSTAI